MAMNIKASCDVLLLPFQLQNGLLNL